MRSEREQRALRTLNRIGGWIIALTIFGAYGLVQHVEEQDQQAAQQK